MGGGVGGVAAALRATTLQGISRNIKVCITEETDWIGGQMTAQGLDLSVTPYDPDIHYARTRNRLFGLADVTEGRDNPGALRFGLAPQR